MKRLINFGFIILAVFVQCAIAAPDDQQIVEKLRVYTVANQSAQIAMLRSLVNINSGTSNVAGVRRVGEQVRRELQKLGFKTRWVAEPPAMHKAPTLIAERSGKQGKHILLIGHLDTVFAKNSPFKHFELNKKTAKGPGVVDDKGGIVVIIYALKALQNAHLLNNTSITIVLTGDEEDSGKPVSISRKALRDAAKDKDVALDFEPAITIDTATIARRGITQWVLEAQGNESHSATIFQTDVGDGAIFELARILDAMRQQLQNQQYLSFNPGVILAGTSLHFNQTTAQGEVFGKENVVAKIGMVRGDLRFLTSEQKQKTERDMSDITAKHLPGTKAQITFVDGMPAMPPSKANEKLLEQYSAASQTLGFGAITALDPGLRGAGDISFVNDIIPAKLAGLGPVGFGTHAVGERIELDSLPIQIQRAALFIYQLTR